jgi:hypothetical protein
MNDIFSVVMLESCLESACFIANSMALFEQVQQDGVAGAGAGSAASQAGFSH